jgi:hypothetical protein
VEGWDMRMKPIPIALFLLILTEHAPAIDVRDLNIIPSPKEIRLTGLRMPLVIDKKPAVSIVLAGQPCRQAEIGANEINQKVESVGGVHLPVRSEAELVPADWARPLIVLGLPGKSKRLADLCRRANIRVSANDPGPQGYQVGFFAGKAVLVGCDPLGLLYACVTFRYLIHNTADGVAAYQATIRDWPDCRWRFTWSTLRDWQRIATGWDGKYPPARPREGVAAAKAGLDWLLRHKINVWFSGHGASESGQMVLQPLLPEVLHYGFERGIWGFTEGPYGNLGVTTPDKPRRELEVCFSYSHGNRLSYWCWSRDKETIERYEAGAREIASAMPKDFSLGGMFVYLHMPDTANMGWHLRCEQCRARFGNDQAAAQANLFNHFCRAMRRYLPRVKLVLVPRPYVGFDMTFPENKVYRDRLEKLARLIPKGTYLVHVETTREAVNSWKRLTKGLQIAHWVNCQGRWLDMFFRLNKTYQVDPEDAIFQGGPYEEWALEVLGAAETMWNANSPLAVAVCHDTKQPSRLEVWHDEGDKPEDIYRHKFAFSNGMVEGRPIEEWAWLPPEEKAGERTKAFLRHAANELYGEKAGPLMLQILTAGCLDRYVEDPLGYVNGKYATSKVMGSQVRAYESAATAAEKLCAERIEFAPGMFAGGVAIEGLEHRAHVFRVSVHQTFNFYVHLAQAAVWQPLLTAREALASGKTDEAFLHISKAENQLTTQAEMLRDVFHRLEARQRYRMEMRPEMLDNALQTLHGLKPKIELMRIETELKATIKAFPERPFVPRYTSGKMKVAIYVPPAGEGEVTGAVGLRETLAQDPLVEVQEVHNLLLETLLSFDVLVFPSCTKMPAADLARIADVRRYVGDFGGGVYAQHNSVGYERFPLRTSMFPEVGNGAERLDSNRVKVARDHPLVKGRKVGEMVEHMYFDHITLDLKGARGVPVLVDAETDMPVVVAGQVGRGRVVLDGSVAYVSLRTPEGKALADKLGHVKDFEHAAYGFSAELLKNGVRWLCGVQ